MFTYKCPNCHQPLELNQRTYRCSNQHSFDMAKEGYVNLMLVQNKKSKQPGDSKDMLRSRQSFLNQGYYSFLVDKLAECINQFGLQSNLKLIDLGCGEGYYSHSLSQHSQLKNIDIEIAGLDIAKVGIQMASKRKFDLDAVVASAFDAPFFDNTFDAAISVFSPLSAQETARILKPKGLLFFVGPGKKHLQGLTEKIYSSAQDHKGNKTPLQKGTEFEPVEKFELSQNVTIEQPDLLNLLKMTPYYWQCTAEQQRLFTELKEVNTPLEFTVEVYRSTH